jgi:hypothetical protein
MSPFNDVEITLRFESFDKNDKSFTTSTLNEDNNPLTLMQSVLKDKNSILDSFRNRMDIASVSLSSQSLKRTDRAYREDQQPLQILLIDNELKMLLPTMTNLLKISP